MLRNEARELLVKAYEKNHNAREVAHVFSVSKSTVYKYVGRQRRQLPLDVKTQDRGRKAKLTPRHLREIQCLVEREPQITVREITERLSLPVSRETVRRAVKKCAVNS